MRLRALQLAFMMALLSSIGGAESSARDAHRILRTAYRSVLHQQSLARPEASILSYRLAQADAETSRDALPQPLYARIATPATWAARLHAVTGSGL